MEIIENFLFQNGDTVTITFKNGYSVELSICSKVDVHDLKELLRNIFSPSYCEERVKIKIYGQMRDMTKHFTDKNFITVTELVEILVKVKNFAPLD